MAGADPPDVFLVDAKSVGSDVELDHWLEALNRACPDARIVVLTDEAAEVPSFATHIGRMDAQALRTLLLPEIPVAADLSADVGAVTLGPEFQRDPSVLDRVFADLAPEEAPRPAPAESDAYALARDLLDKGMLEAATAEVSQVIRRGGEVAIGTVLLGRIFARRGLHGEALERFRAAVIDRPDDPDLLLGLADALLALGRGRIEGEGNEGESSDAEGEEGARCGRTVHRRALDVEGEDI